MKPLFLLLALLPSLAWGAPAPSPSSDPVRPRIADFERAPQGNPTLLKRIEAALPVWLLVFLGFSGNLRVEAQAGPVRVVRDGD